MRYEYISDQYHRVVTQRKSEIETWQREKKELTELVKHYTSSVRTPFELHKQPLRTRRCPSCILTVGYRSMTHILFASLMPMA